VRSEDEGEDEDDDMFFFVVCVVCVCVCVVVYQVAREAVVVNDRRVLLLRQKAREGREATNHQLVHIAREPLVQLDGVWRKWALPVGAVWTYGWPQQGALHASRREP